MVNPNQRFEDTARLVDDLIKSQPPVSDLSLTAEWLYDMQSASATLAQSCAEAETEFTKAIFQAVTEIPADVWNRIKASSTMQSNYVAGMYPATYSAYKRLEALKSVMRSAMDNTRTLIVSLREERQTHDAGNVRNTPPPSDESQWPI